MDCFRIVHVRICATFLVICAMIAGAEIGGEADDVVVLDYENLDLTPANLENVRKAFGPQEEALGLLVVKNVPGLEQLRKHTLSQMFKFGTLSPEVQSKFECKGSLYATGWSLGKEMLSRDVPDTAKGSFYFDPLSDGEKWTADMIESNPECFYPNVWPRETLPDFESSAKALSTLVCSVGMKIAGLCDGYVESVVPSYSKGRLGRSFAMARTFKARLLHYFPSSELTSDVDASSASKWCGWHNDHSCLTGLVSAQYFDSEGKPVARDQVEKLGGGLYVRTRAKTLVPVSIPTNCLAFQLGESAQILTGAVLKATPHAVIQPKASGFARDTLAVFMQPDVTERMAVPEGIDPASVSSAFDLPAEVPGLEKRWSDGISFSQFSSQTIAAYYDL